MPAPQSHLGPPRGPPPANAIEAANVIMTRYKGQLKLKDWGISVCPRKAARGDQGDIFRATGRAVESPEI
jgi:hypothetical protein